MPNWEKIAQEQELMAITCYHLGGNEDVVWHWEYDTGLRGAETKHLDTILAQGRDM